MIDVFREARSQVSALDVARFYGMTFDRRGEKVLCIFHPDHHPSMTFRKGNFRCWACGAHGSSIDLTAELLSLTPLDAVKRLNTDFGLNLPLDKKELTPKEKQEVQQRREIRDTYQLFEEWRNNMIRQLNACFREAYFAMKSLETPADLDQLTDAQTLAIREQAHIEYLSDILSSGTMAEKVEVFYQRKGVDALCHRILKNLHHTHRESEAA